jgi:hypothetical protein
MANQAGAQTQRETVEDARDFLEASLGCYTGQEAIFQAGYTLHEVRCIPDARAIQAARAIKRKLKAKFPSVNF